MMLYFETTDRDGSTSSKLCSSPIIIVLLVLFYSYLVVKKINKK